MDITFLIGNGFDLAYSLKTSYSDYYTNYVSDKLDCEGCLYFFKDDIASNLSSWADAELALGAYTSKFSIDNFADFKRCSDDFSINLAKYLKNQEDELDIESYTSKIIPAFAKAILNFQLFLLPKPQKIITTFFQKYRQDHRFYNFINFNYTTLFDRCIRHVANENLIQTRTEATNKYQDRIGRIVHIHGTDTSKLIMGVNDESQIVNPEFRSIRKIRRSLIKPEANESNHLGNDEICGQLITNSRIIIVFGMSLGKTDKTWWETLKNWLSLDNERYLILFMHRKGYDDTIQSNYLEAEEEIENLFFENSGATIEEQNSLRSRIFININIPLFGEIIRE